MKYAILLYADETVWDKADDAGREAIMEAHHAFAKAVHARGRIEAGEALAGAATATTLRHDGETPVLTDGPYTESVEQLGGFYVIEAPDLDAVVELCGVLPHYYSVEIRPVVEM